MTETFLIGSARVDVTPPLTIPYLGYIAPPSAWEIGGYEVSLGTWSIVGAEAMARMLVTAKNLVN